MSRSSIRYCYATNTLLNQQAPDAPKVFGESGCNTSTPREIPNPGNIQKSLKNQAFLLIQREAKTLVAKRPEFMKFWLPGLFFGRLSVFLGRFGQM